MYGFPVVGDFSPLTIGGDHAHALFALHAASPRSAHPAGLVAANAATGVRIASAMIVFFMFASYSNRIVIGKLLAKVSTVGGNDAGDGPSGHAPLQWMTVSTSTNAHFIRSAYLFPPFKSTG